jgi:hypothetical protein
LVGVDVLEAEMWRAGCELVGVDVLEAEMWRAGCELLVCNSMQRAVGPFVQRLINSL